MLHLLAGHSRSLGQQLGKHSYRRYHLATVHSLPRGQTDRQHYHCWWLIILRAVWSAKKWSWSGVFNLLKFDLMPKKSHCSVKQCLICWMALKRVLINDDDDVDDSVSWNMVLMSIVNWYRSWSCSLSYCSNVDVIVRNVGSGCHVRLLTFCCHCFSSNRYQQHCSTCGITCHKVLLVLYHYFA